MNPSISIKKCCKECECWQYHENGQSCINCEQGCTNVLPGCPCHVAKVNPSISSIVGKEVEHIAMNIVYQLDDDSGASVEFRQANNDKRIEFVKKLIYKALTSYTEGMVKSLEGMKKDITDKTNDLKANPSDWNITRTGWNAALTQAINLFKKPKPQAK